MKELTGSVKRLTSLAALTQYGGMWQKDGQTDRWMSCNFIVYTVCGKNEDDVKDSLFGEKLFVSAWPRRRYVTEGTNCHRHVGGMSQNW